MMKEEPLVSVLITSYNREKYIAEAIKSVLSSSYIHFELIVVDDCSTDQTFEIIQAFSKSDSRIKVYRNESNLGQFRNRNRAIELSTGEYIKFLDSDDKLYDHTIEEMMNAMLAFPEAGIGVPVSDLFLKKSKAIPFCINPHDSTWYHYNGSNHLCHGPTACIFSKKALSQSIKFESDIGILADTVFNYKIASIFPTVMFQKGLYYWRIHEDQITIEQRDDVKMIKERYQNLMICMQFSQNPLAEKEIKMIERNFRKINFLHTLKYLMKGKFSWSLQIMKDTKLTFANMLGIINPF